MKQFDYQTLNQLQLDNQDINKLTTIYQLRGQTSSYQIDYHEELARLVAVAKVHSTSSSNRIEGIFTSDSRLNKIMSNKVEPHDRDEEEIAGYRDVLSQINQDYKYMPITSNTILGMHKELFAYSGAGWGGKYKDINNKIVAKYEDGREAVRFNPLAAYLVPGLIEDLCHSYNQAVNRDDFSPLLLSSAFVFDFVSIHPFRDGNGRMSRLLMLLTMYQLGFEVGKYISLEKIIEESKEAYYDALAASYVNWEQNTNNYLPFINYYLGIIVKAYRELIKRIGIVHAGQKHLSSKEMVLKVLNQQLRPLSRAQLVELIPRYSSITIQRTLHDLKKAGQIDVVGAGRNTRYLIHQD